MSGSATYAEWIAVDWGTSNLRAWAMRGAEVLAEASSDKGMSMLDRDGFEPALLELIDPWLGSETAPVVACGMVGARQGWIEASYARVPCPPVGGSGVRAPSNDPRIEVTILPGLAQATPPDVMRGEETQIAGYLAEDPSFDGILCMPGTHTKWVQMSAGEVVSFRTYMTGELFALISTGSVLRHSMDNGFDQDAFKDAVRDGLSNPEALAGRFFALRAEGLLSEAKAGAATARLSGLLIGAELAAAKGYWLGQRIVLLGAGKLSDLYATALAGEGVIAETADVTRTTLAGLTAAYQKTKETT